jgi:ATP-dependent DNA ligase
VTLPFQKPIEPMLAKLADAIPVGDSWIYEPKWDGFRALVFKDGGDLYIQSRDLKPLNRYFPELEAPLLAALPERCVLDGEIVIAGSNGLDFDALQLRLHPAATRAKTLSLSTPASIVFFDLLALGDTNYCDMPFALRRTSLESVLAEVHAPLHITPATTDRGIAADWFKRFEGAGLDGVIAKSQDETYAPNKRVMLKIKHERDCDCVVAGFRWHKDSGDKAVGSLLLGLYDDSGHLEHVGVCASFTMDKRREMVAMLEPYRKNATKNHPWIAGDVVVNESAAAKAAKTTDPQRMPGAQSRWSAGKDASWEPLRPELVLEVAYDHMQSGRFRHTAQFRRWRSDKRPADCTFEQLETVPPQELAKIFPTAVANAAKKR